MALIDQYGRPVRRQELIRPQAEPGITSVRQAFAATVASGLTPQKLAGILRACDEGDIDAFMTLAEEMEERDPHYASVLGVRKRAVSGVSPQVVAASEAARDQEIANAVRDHIAEHDGFADLVEDALDAVGKGFAVVEIDWQRDARRWWPRGFDWRSQRFFRFDRETLTEIRLLDAADLVEGTPLAPFKFIVHRARLKSGLTFRGGVARVVAFNWMCKAYTLKDWVAFIETYGLPLRVGKYGPQATKEDVDTLFRAVANIGTDAAAVIPESMKLEFVEMQKGGGGDSIFETLARWADEQTSKAVLGQTMTSDNGSSMAQAEVHNEVRHDIAAADARAVAGTLNRDLVRPFVDLNFGVQRDYPKLVIPIAEPEDLDLIMKNALRASAMGVRFSAAEVRAKIGFSDPEEGDELTGVGAAAGGGDVAMNRADDPAPPDPVDEIEAELADEWAEAGAALVAPVEAAIAGATDWQDALARLEAIRPGEGTGPMIEALVKGMFAMRGVGDQRDG